MREICANAYCYKIAQSTTRQRQPKLIKSDKKKQQRPPSKEKKREKKTKPEEQEGMPQHCPPAKHCGQSLDPTLGMDTCSSSHYRHLTRAVAPQSIDIPITPYILAFN
jgi:hypothetical protein